MIFSDFDQSLELKFSAEIDSRVTTKRNMAKIELPADEDSFPYLAPQGTIMCVVGYENSPSYEALLKATQHSLRDVDDVLKAYVERNVHEDLPTSIAPAFENLLNIRSLVEVKHGQKILASGYPVLEVENKDLTILSFPYNGGDLVDTGLELIEFNRPDVEASVHGLMFVRPPALSDLEKAAVSLVPPDKRELNIGSPVAGTPMAVGVALATGALTAIAWCATKYNSSPIDYMIDPIDATRLNELSPEATAVELLKLRRDLMLGKEIEFESNLGI